jgi:hypothetical protein
LWFVVCGLWFVVCGLWFVVCGLWFVVCGLWFGYNVQNLRTQKTIGSSVTVYHYDLQGRLQRWVRSGRVP